MGICALYDPNVLFSAKIRDVLIEVARTPLCRARWSEAILEEMTEAVLSKRPQVQRERMRRLCALMNQAVPDCLVENYAHLIPKLQLPDPGDRHVLAAAIAGGAQVIVTENRAHFPASALKPHGIRTQTADAFLTGLLSGEAEIFIAALERVRQRLSQPAESMAVFLDGLEKRGLTKTVLDCVNTWMSRRAEAVEAATAMAFILSDRIECPAKQRRSIQREPEAHLDNVLEKWLNP